MDEQTTPLRGHRQVEHTADLAVEFWAPAEAQLLEEGAQAVVHYLTEGQDIQGIESRHIELQALDAEDRMVCWLNEVLIAGVLDGFLVASAQVSLGGETELTATLLGESDAFSRIRSELKSVTYHDLELLREDTGCRARVVIDV